MQRDNKIKVLEDKMKQLQTDVESKKGGGVQQKEPQKQALVKNNRQRSVDEPLVKDKIVKHKDSDKLLQLDNNKQKDKKAVKFQQEDEDSEEQVQPDLKPVRAKPFLFGPVDNI